MRYLGPKDIARSLNGLLARARVAIPAKTIETFFQVLFFASQRTEEDHPIRCHIVYLDPANPDPSPPRPIRLHRWSITRLADMLEFSDKNLSKLARATDFRCSSVAVFHDKEGALFIWGMVDHDNQNAFYTHDAQTGPEMPGLFQSSIEGVGNLACYFRKMKVSELRHGQLARQPVDVFGEGPIRRKLNRPIKAYLDATDRAIPFSTFQSSRWKHLTEKLWIATLCRLIIRVRSLRKGASLLITDRELHKGLSVKYSMGYHRLQAALQRNSILKLKARHASESVHFSLS